MKNLVKSCLLFSLVLVFWACKEDDAVIPTYSITGELINANNRAVKNATVELIDLSNNTTLVSGRTDNEGKYTLSGINGGTYQIRLQATGYLEKSRSITISDNLGNQKDTIRGRANVSGRIINSQTGFGLANASVSFSLGSDTTATLADLEVKTNSQGNFNLSEAPEGSFVQVIRARGFMPRVNPQVSVNSGSNNLGNSVLVETLALGQMRIVLTWGLNPGDLDSHLTGPNESGNSRFHLYFGNKSPNTQVNLDVDRMFGYGPETVTIRQFYTGTYRYSVNNYSNRGNRGGLEILNSPAKVELYDHTGLRQTFSPPPFVGNAGNTWRVFELNATTAGVQIVPINTYLDAYYGDATAFRPAPDTKSLAPSFFRNIDK
jgi:hypothetical protein